MGWTLRGGSQCLPPITGAEEADEVAEIVALGVDVDLVNVESGELLLLLEVSGAGGGLKLSAGDGAGGVDEDSFAGFGVGQFNQPGVGYGQFAGINDGDGDEVVVDGGELEGFFAVVVLKVGDEEGYAFSFDHFAEVVEGLGNVGSVMFGLEGEDFADDVQDVHLPFSGRDEIFNLVGEDDEADLVVVFNGGEGEEATELGGDLVFGFSGRAVGAGAGHIDEKEEGLFALFDEAFDEGLSGTCGYIPVDGADFVAGLVFADFVELHAAPFEYALVFAAKQFVDHPLAGDLDLTNLFE